MSKLVKLIAGHFVCLSAFTALASEVITYEVKGMRCNSCAQMISKKVCSHHSLESCKVTVGEVTYQVKDGETFTKEELTALLKQAGKYEIVN